MRFAHALRHTIIAALDVRQFLHIGTSESSIQPYMLFSKFISLFLLPEDRKFSSAILRALYETDEWAPSLV